MIAFYDSSRQEELFYAVLVNWKEIDEVDNRPSIKLNIIWSNLKRADDRSWYVGYSLDYDDDMRTVKELNILFDTNPSKM
jgi:hypothetical protein